MFNSHPNVRFWTTTIQDAMDQGILDPRAVADMALSWLSEDSVKQMAFANDLRDLVPDEDEEDDDEEEEEVDPLDDFNYVGSRHHY